MQFPNVKDPPRTNLLSLFFLFLFAILRTTKQPRSSLALVAGCQKSLWYEFGQKHTALARGRSVAVASRALIRSLHSSLLSSSQAGEDKADKSLTVEVGMLMPPGICGEMGVVDPHKGIALGSVIADTMVECLVLHKVHIQTCDVTLDWLQHLRRKARIIYPEDDEIRKKTQASRIAQRQVRHAARKLQR